MLQLVQLHESLNSSGSRYEYGYEASQTADRTLYLTDKLYESCQRAVCDNACLQMLHTPYECKQVACSESHIHHHLRNAAVSRTLNDLRLQMLLLKGETFADIGDTVEGLYDGTMPQTLLYAGQYVALRFANGMGYIV